MKKVDIIKFVPYFPPHAGGLESHVQEWSFWRVKSGYGEVINVTSPMGQIEEMTTGIHEKISFHGKIIGYKKDGYQVIVFDSFDLIPVFPFPKFWTRQFWVVILYLRQHVKQNKNSHILVNTHTRFFVSSLVGGLFAKCLHVPWVHIEHGVDFVKLASRWKTYVAYIYDQTVGRYIFRCADKVVGISEGCKKFIQKFTKRPVEVIHRGMEFVPGKPNVTTLHIPKHTLVMGFVGRIVKLKGLDILIDAFDNLHKKYPQLVLQIVGDGDQLTSLQQKVSNLGLQDKISFLGYKDRTYVANDFLPHVDIVVNPSYQEGLPTSVLEGLLSRCVVVATDVGGTSEISDKDDLILVKPGNEMNLYLGLKKAINTYKKVAGLSKEHVLKEFDWNKNIKKYNKVYLGMMGYEK